MLGKKFVAILACVGLLALVACGDDGGSGSAPCNSACGNLDRCAPEVLPNCGQLCATAQEEASAISQECATDLDTLLNCLGGLNMCLDIVAWVSQTPADGYPCQAPTDACNAACNDECLSDD